MAWHVSTEIADQPSAWARAASLAMTEPTRDAFPEPGQRVAVIGCGTSFFMGQSFAALRERSGHGETDAFPASEFPTHRSYDAVVALSRSGTTTEVLRLLETLRNGTGPRTVAITAGPRSTGRRAGGSSRDLGLRRREIHRANPVRYHVPGLVAGLAGRRPHRCHRSGTIRIDRSVAADARSTLPSSRSWAAACPSGSRTRPH